MPIEIKMPALSPTMEEGTLAKWLIKEGDAVKSGDIMPGLETEKAPMEFEGVDEAGGSRGEIATGKASMEFEALDEGVVSKLLIAEGADNVKVGTVIATLAGEG